MSVEDEITTLQNRLTEQEQQLSDIEKLLAESDDPDGQLAALKQDLIQVMNLTSIALNEKRSASVKSSSNNNSVSNSNSNYRPVVGERVLALWSQDQKFYAARVDLIDQIAGSVTVTWLDFGSVGNVLLKDLKKLPLPDPALLVEHCLIRAIFPSDGLFHDAVVDGVLQDPPNHYLVRFTKKGKKQYSLPISEIRLRSDSLESRHKKIIAGVLIDLDQNGNLPKEITIPPQLQIKDTDSEAAKLKKKQKVKKLRAEWKRQLEESESIERASDWKNWAGATLKKAKFTIKKESIFKSPEDLDGRVGVIGSGRGMTQIAEMKKHTFVDDEGNVTQSFSSSSNNSNTASAAQNIDSSQYDEMLSNLTTSTPAPVPTMTVGNPYAVNVNPLNPLNLIPLVPLPLPIPSASPDVAALLLAAQNKYAKNF